MNNDLENLKKAIEESGKLTEQKKESLLNSIKDIDKEIAILEFKLQRTEKVKRTTSVLLEETIDELEKKRKVVEEKNRELEIETALERVRARTMAMQKSEELSETAALLFQELKSLEKIPERLGIVTYIEEKKIFQNWVTDQNGMQIANAHYSSVNEPTTFKKIFQAWKNNKESLIIDLTGDELGQWLLYVKKELKLNVNESQIKNRRVHYIAFHSYGFLMCSYHEPLKVNFSQLFIRFAKVFEQTYTRFLDLKKAEAQASEAIKQASLDRVRGEIASMRTSEDLNRITPVIWRELQALEVPFIRCGVFIVDEKNKKVQIFLTTPKGKALGVLHLSFDANELTRNTVDHWQKKQVYQEHWNKKEFINWTKSMKKLGQVQNTETYQGSAEAPESLHLHFVPFKQGMLYVGNITSLTDDELELLKTLAEAFSIAYARYEDFKNLEEAKNKIEVTLNELKAAQTQLIQSEKMASLGELTAGIAHEIQNPLNFVNNFSELSNELLEELKEEIENGNNAEVEELLEDVVQNLKKINYHGQRASSIVKGMLLHSRGSSGQKEPTDINALCDEYLHLSYHGFRAKDKSFNADFKLEADENLPKAKVVPQDIGRVLLNLINNAFYAVQAPLPPEGGFKEPNNIYKPMVTVKTSFIPPPAGGGQRGAVVVSVADNGPGIPSSIKDKIFQPFFTTKPTGSGTGLGLSLSYDIVKAHGGEIKVESYENEGTEFIISIPAI